MTAPDPPSVVRLRWAGVATLLGAALARGAVRHDPLPGWTMDPTALWSPVLGVGPAGSLALDVVTLLAASAVLLAERLGGRPVPKVALALLGVGSLSVLWHGLFRQAGTLDDLRLGGAWLGALGGALAVREAARDPAVRRTVLAVIFGFAVVLAGRGVMQVFVEHASTVEDFQQRRELILHSHGWEPGSSAALVFERRLTQPEASGWFGMSNVYASVMAACMVGLAGVAIAAVRSGTRPEGLPRIVGLLPTLGAAVAASGLVLGPIAGGQTPKGAVVAGAIGFALLGGAAAARRLGLGVRAGAIVGLGVVAAALSAVVVRGLIGERIGELSILFRWFYAQAAIGIFADAPLAGVGPDGFKTAYLIHRNPLSPEEVASPHSVMLDWLATLGIGAVAWIALWLWWVAAAGRRLFDAPDPMPAVACSPRSLPGGAVISAIVFALACTLVLEELPVVRSVPSASGALLMEVVIRLGVWGVAWAAVAWACLAAAPRALDRGAAAAALVLAIHGQIEMTLTMPGSAALGMLVIGAAGAPSAIPARSAAPSLRGAIPAFVPVALAALLAVFGFVPAMGAERSMREGARLASVAGVFAQRASAIEAGDPLPGDSLDALTVDLGRSLGRQPPRTLEEFLGALTEVRLTAGDAADAALERAALARRSHPSIGRSLARLRGQGASVAVSLGRPADGRLDGAEGAALATADRWPHRPETLSTLAAVLLLRAEITGEERAWSGAVAALERGAWLDPFGVEFPVRLAEVHLSLGREEDARFWARRAFDNDALKRLDPLAGIDDRRRERLDELLSGS